MPVPRACTLLFSSGLCSSSVVSARHRWSLLIIITCRCACCCSMLVVGEGAADCCVQSIYVCANLCVWSCVCACVCEAVCVRVCDAVDVRVLQPPSFVLRCVVGAVRSVRVVTWFFLPNCDREWLLVGCCCLFITSLLAQLACRSTREASPQQLVSARVGDCMRMSHSASASRSTKTSTRSNEHVRGCRGGR